MDLTTLLTAMTATGIASVAAAQYLSKRLLEHRLSKDLKDYEANIGERLTRHKADLDKVVNDAKAESEARLKKEIEEYLGERLVERNYRAEARKRLYLAVGPLRFQLLVAAAELANRVSRIGDGQYVYDMSIKGYFGQSTAYRMLRVLAIVELIERQVSYADFTVDPEMRELLKFKRQAFLSLSSHRVSLGHPQEDWSRQEQHVFYDVLGIIASAMIVQEGPASSRVLRFDEFSALAGDKDELRRIDPIPRLVNDFTVESKPILWLRFLALAQLCIGLMETHGSELGLELDQLNLELMLDQTNDNHIRINREKYLNALTSFRTSLTATEA
jgi:hypothetical protein